MVTDDNLIPISALQHYSYCPRQCGLIHIEQIFDENFLTMRGRAAHKRVDTPGVMHTDAVRVERALPLFSENLRLTGKADVVEFDKFGNPFPVEYKHGRRHAHRHDDIQLAAQAMCLEEMTNKIVSRGAIYHHSSRHRRDVDIDDKLREITKQTIMLVGTMLQSGRLPPPVADERCFHCSLRDACQPEMLHNVKLDGERLCANIFDDFE